MQVKIQRKAVKFKPVELKIIFETQQEIDYFYAIFNHVDILGSTNNHIDGRIIRADLMQYTVDSDGAFIHLKESLNNRYDIKEGE